MITLVLIFLICFIVVYFAVNMALDANHRITERNTSAERSYYESIGALDLFDRNGVTVNPRAMMPAEFNDHAASCAAKKAKKGK
jgi:hypothetical protein